MEEKNYFDKFVQDLERREENQRQHREDLQRDEENWKQRRDLERLYREHVAQRIRYQK